VLKMSKEVVIRHETVAEAYERTGSMNFVRQEIVVGQTKTEDSKPNESKNGSDEAQQQVVAESKENNRED
jgi:hypothetical protein